jgi:hypothetical protein
MWLQVTVSQEGSREVEECFRRLLVLVGVTMGRAWSGDQDRAKVGIANVRSILRRFRLGRQTKTVCQDGCGADCRAGSLTVV